MYKIVQISYVFTFLLIHLASQAGAAVEFSPSGADRIGESSSTVTSNRRLTVAKRPKNGWFDHPLPWHATAWLFGS